MPAEVSSVPFVNEFDWTKVDLSTPRVTAFGNLLVVRDDLVPGGTKARFLKPLVAAMTEDPDGVDVAYASPAQGGMQLALAMAFGERAVLWYPHRRVLAPRQRETLLHGAKHVYVPHPHVRPVQVRLKLKTWAEASGALNLRWSLSYPEVVRAIALVARSVHDAYGPFDEVWCAGGGGTLTRGLLHGFPQTTVHVVGTGRSMSPHEVAFPGGPTAIAHDPPDYRMDARAKRTAPFPVDPYYDGKAFEVAQYGCQCCGKRAEGNWLFWNVIAPPPE